MLVPVILSGGAGSRLWPVSREAYPKPFIRLPDGKTLLQKTFDRAVGIPGTAAVITVTNREYYFLTKEEYARSDASAELSFLLEPCGRNTAPAVAIAAFHALARFGEDVQLLVLPADHLIEDVRGFRSAVEAASVLARDGTLVTFGIAPVRPETGYGYIEYGAPTFSGQGFGVTRFVEKPNLAVAKDFVASGRFLWNSGMFCFNASAFLRALQTHTPELYATAERCWAGTEKDASGKVHLDADEFSKFDDVSIDYAVMEKHPRVAVVRATFDWNDIGSWSAVSDLTHADSEGNRISGEAIMVDATNCYIQSDSRMVAMVGVKNLVVVDTPDALLITDRERVQDVKSVVSQLKVQNHATHQFHVTVRRPWGTYTTVAEGPNHRIKRITVKPQATLSLQMHHHRSEHWVVLSGIAEVVNGSKEYKIYPNESTFIPAGRKHRLANAGKDELVIIEVQTGSYVGEDDIVRFEDVYGRV